mmetsp:Transcript_137032/g.238233  ORF Transcript_137032/g.238233 Transcript_137032/m.238233 type:complete len:88 (-) Transcript_137032:222-485(-)
MFISMDMDMCMCMRICLSMCMCMTPAKVGVYHYSVQQLHNVHLAGLTYLPPQATMTWPALNQQVPCSYHLLLRSWAVSQRAEPVPGA